MLGIIGWCDLHAQYAAPGLDEQYWAAEDAEVTSIAYKTRPTIGSTQVHLAESAVQLRGASSSMRRRMSLTAWLSLAWRQS